jgi:hypothetical protein
VLREVAEDGPRVYNRGVNTSWPRDRESETEETESLRNQPKFTARGSSSWQDVRGTSLGIRGAQCDLQSQEREAAWPTGNESVLSDKSGPGALHPTSTFTFLARGTHSYGERGQRNVRLPWDATNSGLYAYDYTETHNISCRRADRTNLWFVSKLGGLWIGRLVGGNNYRVGCGTAIQLGCRQSCLWGITRIHSGL